MRTRIISPESGSAPDIDQRILGALLGLLDRFFEAAVMLVAAVELADEIEPLALAARDLIEVFLHLGGELDVDEIAEMLAQQPGDRERREARHERLALPEHVAAALDGADRRGEGRRTADADPLELLDQRRFGVARRRVRLVRLRLRGPARRTRVASAVDALADRQRRQHALLLFELGCRIVAALDVGAAEAGELDRLARRREHRRLAVVAGRA